MWHTTLLYTQRSWHFVPQGFYRPSGVPPRRRVALCSLSLSPCVLPSLSPHLAPSSVASGVFDTVLVRADGTTLLVCCLDCSLPADAKDAAAIACSATAVSDTVAFDIRRAPGPAFAAGDDVFGVPLVLLAVILLPVVPLDSDGRLARRAVP